MTHSDAPSRAAAPATNTASATPPNDTALEALFASDGPLATALEGYEVRAEQHAMAQAIQHAFNTPKHLAVEAGTGVGKTFAYLIPALRSAAADGKRVLISTHTITLQEQLVDRDLPQLLSALQLDLRVELVKGRNNYLGLRRLQNASQRQQQLFRGGNALTVLHQIEDWAYTTTDGSLSDLPSAPPLEVWEKVRSEHNNCLGRRCPNYEPCFYQRARRRAEKADILVTNHALLIADLVLRQNNANVLPDYDLLVVDEAHTLDQVATDHAGMTVSNIHVQLLLSGLFNDRTGKGLLASLGDANQRDAAVIASRAAAEFYEALEHWQLTRGRSNGRLVARNPVEDHLTPHLSALAEELAELKESLPRAEDQVEVAAAIERLTTAAHQLQALLGQQFDDHVYWIEVDPRQSRRTALCGAPIDSALFLKQQLFDRVSSVILTSATLTVPEKQAPRQVDTPPQDTFDFVLSRLGAADIDTVQLGSPFDYESQVEVIVEAGLPEPSDTRAFIPAASTAISRHLRESEGRALVLFTSYGMLSDMVQIVRDDLDADGFTLLAQGEDLTRSQLLDQFRVTPRCAIFGTDSFWQGVDVRGAALSCVIIVKLPFTVPDRPTLEARLEHIRATGQNPFMDYQVPEAILRFRQGFGRLIRSQTDTGRVVVLDPRILRKSYGKRFVASLPVANVQFSQQPW